eukprot:455862-Hanusia_phi.AAC.1
MIRPGRPSTTPSTQGPGGRRLLGSDHMSHSESDRTVSGVSDGPVFRRSLRRIKVGKACQPGRAP